MEVLATLNVSPVSPMTFIMGWKFHSGTDSFNWNLVQSSIYLQVCGVGDEGDENPLLLLLLSSCLGPQLPRIKMKVGITFLGKQGYI